MSTCTHPDTFNCKALGQSIHVGGGRGADLALPHATSPFLWLLCEGSLITRSTFIQQQVKLLCAIDGHKLLL